MSTKSPLEAGSEIPPIPMREWGKDHWSTLAYAETCAAANRPIDNRRMRCIGRLHRAFMHHVDGNSPTRLAGGRTIEPHDDWSCLEDAVAEGLLAIDVKHRLGDPFGGSRATVRFTPYGRRIVERLREHKAEGGNFADFRGWAFVEEGTA